MTKREVVVMLLGVLSITAGCAAGVMMARFGMFYLWPITCIAGGLATSRIYELGKEADNE